VTPIRHLFFLLALIMAPLIASAQIRPGAPPPTGSGTTSPATSPSSPGTRPGTPTPEPGTPGTTPVSPPPVPGSPLTTPGPPVGTPTPPPATSEPPVGTPVPPLTVPGPSPTPAPPASTPPLPGLAAPPPGDRPATAAPPNAGRVLTLPEALTIALERQPNIQARLFDYAAARFRVDQAFSPMLPQLTANAQMTRAQNNTLFTSPTTLTATPLATQRDFSETLLAQVSLSQLLFDFGKNLAATDVAKRLADVAKEDIEVQRDLIVLAVKEAYVNLLFAKRLILVNRQAVERAELNLRSARGFFEVGTRPRSDVTRAEVDLANARVDSIRARNAEQLARVALNTAMGIPINTPTEVEDILAYQPISIDGTQLLPEALRQRAEYRQARLRVEAAEATVKQTFRNFFPDLFGTASYGGVRFELAEVWSFGFTLNWSIFDGGNRIARYRESRALLDAAQARVQATELDIWQQTEQANLNVQEAQERIQAAAVAVQSAQENFRLAQGRFDAGVGTILEVTDAQLALTQAQNLEAQALADFRIAVSRLERALGRR
jgi:outer membrane protein